MANIKEIIQKAVETIQKVIEWRKTKAAEWRKSRYSKIIIAVFGVALAGVILMFLDIGHDRNSGNVLKTKDCPLKIGDGSKIPDLSFFTDGFPTLKIISLANSIIINSVKMNRGNCKVSDKWSYGLLNKAMEFPAKMGYGDSIEIVYTCKDVLEIEIKTNKGICRFGYNSGPVDDAPWGND